MSAHSRKWIGSVVACVTVLVLSFAANASILTYRFVNASASFVTDQFSAPGATSFTLNINGTFSYDLTNLVATTVDAGLSGPIPPIIDQFEAYDYSAVFSGLGFTFTSFSAINPPFDDTITWLSGRSGASSGFSSEISAVTAGKPSRQRRDIQDSGLEH